MSMPSPIQNRVGAVFVPVSDMTAAIAWYSRLLGLEPGAPSHDGRIYDLPMAGEVGVILDAHRPVRSSSQPLLFFWTADLAATHRFLREAGIELEREIEDIGSVTTLTLRDPDGNLLMVCRRNA